MDFLDLKLSFSLGHDFQEAKSDKELQQFFHVNINNLYTVKIRQNDECWHELLSTSI